MARAATPAWVATTTPIGAAIAALLDPHGEVVLHDLARDEIVAIWNPISGRSVGDASLLEELPDRWERLPVQGPYPKTLDDGSPCSAVSCVVRDEAGVPRGMLCINFDRGPLLAATRMLDAFAAPVVEAPAELFSRDWREQIATSIDAHCRTHGLARTRLDRAARADIVAALEAQGLFATRGAAEHAATALGVSRATIYNLLREVRT